MRYCVLALVILSCSLLFDYYRKTVVNTRIKLLCLLERVEPCLQRFGSYPMNIRISVIIIISYHTIYLKEHHINLFYNIYYTIFKTSHYVRDGVL